MFPAGASGEPLSEWPAELLGYTYPDCPTPPNDVYGKAFYYLRDLLVRFQKRIRELSLNVTILSGPSSTTLLPTAIPSHILGTGFDRIEVRLDNRLIALSL